MADSIQEVTEEGLRIPRRLLEQWGFAPGRRMLIARTASGVYIRPDEVTQEEVTKISLSYLLRHAGDMAGIRTPEPQGGGWRVPVALMPEGQELGHLIFDVHGVLLTAESTTPDELADAADAVADNAPPSGAELHVPAGVPAHGVALLRESVSGG